MPIIKNCKVLFKFICPKNWEYLRLTNDENVRFCNRCRKKVYLCTTDKEIEEHAGDCIAVRSGKVFVYTIGESRRG